MQSRWINPVLCVEIKFCSTFDQYQVKHHFRNHRNHHYHDLAQPHQLQCAFKKLVTAGAGLRLLHSGCFGSAVGSCCIGVRAGLSRRCGGLRGHIPA